MGLGRLLARYSRLDPWKEPVTQQTDGALKRSEAPRQIRISPRRIPFQVQR